MSGDKKGPEGDSEHTPAGPLLRGNAEISHGIIGENIAETEKRVTKVLRGDVPIKNPYIEGHEPWSDVGWPPKLYCSGFAIGFIGSKQPSAAELEFPISIRAQNLARRENSSGKERLSAYERFVLEVIRYDKIFAGARKTPLEAQITMLRIEQFRLASSIVKNNHYFRIHKKDYPQNSHASIIDKLLAEFLEISRLAETKSKNGGITGDINFYKSLENHLFPLAPLLSTKPGIEHLDEFDDSDFYNGCIYWLTEYFRKVIANPHKIHSYLAQPNIARFIQDHGIVIPGTDDAP